MSERDPLSIRGVAPAALRALVAEMREGGVGVLTIGDVTVDLTRAPQRVPTPTLPAPAPADDEDGEDRDRVLFGAGAGRRVPLPFGGKT